MCQYSVVLHVVHNVTQRLPIQQLRWPGPTAGGGLKIGEKVFPTSLKAQFQDILSFSLLSDYQNQVPEGLSNIDIVFILSRIPNPILLSLLLETSSHCRLTADIVVIHPFPILAPSPPPSPSWSVKRWHLKGGGWILWGGLGIDNDTLINRIQSPLQQLLKRWSIRSRWRERGATEPGWESALGRRWSKEHPQCMNDHLLFHLFFTGQRKGSSMNIINHSLSLFPEYIQIINNGQWLPAFST